MSASSSSLIDREYFLLQTAAYIHNNPVRRELCENAIEYVWSTAWHWHEGLRGDSGVLVDDAEIARLWSCAVRDPLSEVVKRNMQRSSEE